MPDGASYIPNTTSRGFAKIMEAVALELLGDPHERHHDGLEWRYGTRGSLSIRIDKGTWYDNEAGAGGGTLDLIRRQNGGDKAAALEWLRERKLIDERPAPKGKGQIVATYDFADAEGVVLFQVVRYEPKNFRQRRPDGRGGWVWNMEGVRLVPFRLPEVLAAVGKRTIYIAEGEKGVLALEAIGLTGTNSPGGAGKWRKDYNAVFKGADVVILPDNDDAGRNHAKQVASHLLPVARSVRILALPGLAPKGDVADWVANGGTAAQLEKLIASVDVASAEPEAEQGGKGEPIRLCGGQLHNEATAGEQAILDAGRPIYQRGKGLVRPAVQIVPAAHGRATHSACLVDVTPHGLIDHLCSVATWERFDARSGKWTAVNPPMAVAHTILSRAGEWRFPRIAGVITTPTLRPDGSILDAAGYDDATRLFHMVDPDIKLHPATKAPTRADAEKALALLSSLLTEFPFTDEVSRAVALSGLITPVVRGALAVAPLHAFKAYTPGTGKSYLVDVSSAISTGRPCPVASAAADEQETEKRIAGLLLAGLPITSIDNVNGELGGDLLCQAVERPLVQVRPLGQSDMVEIENRSTLFATGNNLRVRGDMVRRTVVCCLDAGVERPELRDFKAAPVDAVMDDRGRYVSACLIIVRAYAGVGRPGMLKPIASFEDWSNSVRSALVWLGCEDPAQSMEAARDDDPELTELREFLGLWHEAFGTDALAAREVAQQIGLKEESQMGEPTDFRFPDLRDTILRLFGERGEVNTKRMGRWMLAREGRIVDGLRLKRGAADSHAKVQRWVVDKVRHGR